MEFLTLPFMQTALAASLLAGNAMAILGLFVLMRRVAFSGLAASQLAALGGVIAVVLNMHEGFSAALALVLLGLVLLSRLEKIKRVPPEAWVAALYVLGASVAVLMLAKAAHGEAETLNVFFGNVLTLDWREVVEAAIIVAAVVPVFTIFFHKWVWMSFDAQSAEVAGIAVNRWSLVFFGLMALAMTFTIHLVGVLLAFAYLILPATAALLMVRRVRYLYLAVPAIATVATFFGFMLSFQWDLPTGPFVSALLAVIVAVAGLIKVATEKT